MRWCSSCGRPQAARRDPDFTIIARTDARAVDGFEAAVERWQIATSAGADVIFPEALEDAGDSPEFAPTGRRTAPGQHDRFRQDANIDPEEFQRLGYRIVIYPATPLRVALAAMRAFLSEMGQAGAQAAWTPRMMTRQELYELIDYPTYQAWE